MPLKMSPWKLSREASGKGELESLCTVVKAWVTEISVVCLKILNAFLLINEVNFSFPCLLYPHISHLRLKLVSKKLIL